MKGTCKHCRGRYSLKKDKTVWRHNAYPGSSMTCPGSGRLSPQKATQHPTTLATLPKYVEVPKPAPDSVTHIVELNAAQYAVLFVALEGKTDGRGNSMQMFLDLHTRAASSAEVLYAKAFSSSEMPRISRKRKRGR